MRPEIFTSTGRAAGKCGYLVAASVGRAALGWERGCVAAGNLERQARRVNLPLPQQGCSAVLRWLPNPRLQRHAGGVLVRRCRGAHHPAVAIVQTVTGAPLKRSVRRRALDGRLCSPALVAGLVLLGATSCATPKPVASIQSRCGVAARAAVTKEQAICIATLTGLESGIEPWEVTEMPALGGGRAVWIVANFLRPRRCNTSPGFQMIIAKEGGIVLDTRPSWILCDDFGRDSVPVRDEPVATPTPTPGAPSRASVPPRVGDV